MIEDQREASPPTSWECFTAAVQFLTRIPVGGNLGKSVDRCAEALRRGVVFFPIVGGLIGIFTSVILLLASVAGLSPVIAALLAIGLEFTLTGAFHEDAFADTWDALGGGWNREEILAIMKDSRLGTYGTLSLIIGVGLRVAATASLVSTGWPATLATIVAASTLGRLAIIGMMATTAPVAGRESRARDVSGMQTGWTFLKAALMSVPLFAMSLWVSPFAAAVAMVVSAVVLCWFRRCILRRVGGTTGDLLGCSACLVQLIVLVTSTGKYFHA